VAEEPFTETLDFAFYITPLSQTEACKRVRYWYENFLSPTFESEFTEFDKLFSKADWIDWLFSKDCPTERTAEFFQFFFIGDPSKLPLTFFITMAMVGPPNTVLVLISLDAPEGDPNLENNKHNLKVVMDHLKTGIAKPELLIRA
jgi:hypothetical protein